MKTFRLILAAALLAGIGFLPAHAQKPSKGKPATQHPAPTTQSDTLTVITQQATAGNAAAQNTLGKWYYTGQRVKQDYAKAFEWWQKSAAQGYAAAIGNVALCYQLGHGVKADSTIAADNYLLSIRKGNSDILRQHEQLAATKGNTFSQALMYAIYNKGVGVKVDRNKAIGYAEQLAATGNADWQLLAALDLFNAGKPDKAAHWFKLASQRGKTAATYYYGLLLHQGRGVAQDKEKGLQLMQQAYDRGFNGAAYQLGKAYCEGNGTEQDYAKAITLLQRSAAVDASNAGNARWLLAQMYLNGQGIGKDYHLATQWMAAVAEAHKKEWKRLVANPDYADYAIYIKGVRAYYVDRDLATAADCFRQVEKAGIADGTTMQALCLLHKDNAKRNPKKAAKFLAKVCDANPYAAYRLSLLYAAGEGVKADRAKALSLLRQAAEGGIGEAQCELGRRYMEADGVPQDYAQAAQLFLNAEAQSMLTRDAAQLLAKCYELGVAHLPKADNKARRIQQLRNLSDTNTLYNFLRKVEL